MYIGASVLPGKSHEKGEAESNVNLCHDPKPFVEESPR